ncbi:hypothetical protein [Clostridium perfringens]|uniref:hypothetical protein n=1 Tax=Clostridium perfringens TaxID=1502 RepID=UPI001E28EF24|nr:hypothetical protein [Clostridium perfringens]WVL78357.1 hypothetical protein LMS42_014860 [Clostridium perfringens]
MKKMILGMVLGIITTLMMISIGISSTMRNCEFCGERYSTLEVGNKEVPFCNGCFGFNEGVSQAINEPITIEFSNGSYTFDLTR